ncbi:class I SAM-dependent methyltransferase [Alphaproteobacteria bacterium LSUCC0684]
MISSLLYPLQVRAFLTVLQNIRAGTLHLMLADGSTYKFTGDKPGPEADLQINSRAALGQIMRDGKMGFCEAFMTGGVSSTRLAALIELVVLQNAYVEENLKFSRIKTWLRLMYHQMRSNTKAGSRKNISFHYDLGNSFYAKWLDQSMTYSSAIFEDESQDLTRAQEAKYRRLAELADIREGHHVLEIGCGWGGFAEYAARHLKARVTGITISKEQFDYATKRMAEAGLDDLVTIVLKDYRDLDHSYDRIVSIEMFEAVGEAYWPTYFETLSRCLERGGKAALQVITIDDAVFDDYRREPDFIQRYIFPGGMLPSMPALADPIRNAGLRMEAADGFGQHYADTLRVWRERFLAAWPELDGKGFDSRFKRMWELYLAYCEGGFRAGSIDVKQMLLVRE